MSKLINYIYQLFDTIVHIPVNFIVNAIGKINGEINLQPYYIGTLLVSRILFYGFLACMIASLTGTKKYIDKKMKWAQR